ncbi:papain-like cysteine protease family protein [Agrobacterium sp. 22-224-1]
MREGFRIVTTVFQWVCDIYRLPERVRFPNQLELAFEMQTQKWSNWCWAATASSISQYFNGDDHVPQEEIVGRSLGLPPPWVPDESWNRGERMLTGLRIVGCDGATYPGAASFRQVMRQLDGGNPVCVQIKWPAVGRHAVVVHGCWLDEDDEDHFLVGDPCFDYSLPVPGKELRSDYLQQGGCWVQTYHVRAR